MTDPAFRRAVTRAPKPKFSAVLRSDDPPEVRAQRCVAAMGLTGDPRLIAEHVGHVAAVLAVYAEVDGRAYDAGLDSFRSYDAAIAAIRRQREAGA